MDFHKKKFVEETLSEVLQQMREDKNVSLEEVAKAIKINVEYLKALEQGKYDKLPKGVYGRSFLKEYCFYLKLDCQQALALYEKEIMAQAEPEGIKKIFSHKRVKKHQFLSLPKIIRNSILVVVILFFLAYLGVRVRDIIAPPALQISFPPENYISEDTAIEILGVAESDVRIFINEEEILSNEQGEFQYSIHLQQGINIIRVTAKKRYGRDAEAVRKVLVK